MSAAEAKTPKETGTLQDADLIKSKFSWFPCSYGDRLDEPAAKPIPVTIVLQFSPENLARIDKAAQDEELERAEFLQRAAILGINHALRAFDLGLMFGGDRDS